VRRQYVNLKTGAAAHVASFQRRANNRHAVELLTETPLTWDELLITGDRAIAASPPRRRLAVLESASGRHLLSLHLPKSVPTNCTVYGKGAGSAVGVRSRGPARAAAAGGLPRAVNRVYLLHHTSREILLGAFAGARKTGCGWWLTRRPIPRSLSPALAGATGIPAEGAEGHAFHLLWYDARTGLALADPAVPAEPVRLREDVLTAVSDGRYVLVTTLKRQLLLSVDQTV